MSGCIFAIKACIDNRKNLLNSNTFSTCPYDMVNFGPLTAEIGSGVWGTPANFNGFHVLAALIATSLNGSQPNFARCLAVTWAGTLHIHFRGFLPRYGILSCAKFTLHHPVLRSGILVALLTARHLTSGREPKFAALSTGRHLYSAGRPSRWALAHILFMAALCNRGAIIFLPCNFYLSIIHTYILIYIAPKS